MKRIPSVLLGGVLLLLPFSGLALTWLLPSPLLGSAGLPPTWRVPESPPAWVDRMAELNLSIEPLEGSRNTIRCLSAGTN